MPTRTARFSALNQHDAEEKQDNNDIRERQPTTSTMADLTAAIDRLNDRVAELESPRSHEPEYLPTAGDTLAFKTLPARFAVWFNIPLATILFILALPQLLPIPFVPTAIYLGLSYVVIMPLALWYEEQYYPWWSRPLAKPSE